MKEGQRKRDLEKNWHQCFLKLEMCVYLIINIGKKEVKSLDNNQINLEFYKITEDNYQLFYPFIYFCLIYQI